MAALSAGLCATLKKDLNIVCSFTVLTQDQTSLKFMLLLADMSHTILVNYIFFSAGTGIGMVSNIAHSSVSKLTISYY